MIAALDDLNRLELTSETIALRGGLPVLNGRLLEGWQSQVEHQAGSLIVHFTMAGSSSGRFGIEAHRPGTPGEPGWLRYWVEDLLVDFALDSFGLHFSTVENVRAFLRQGYQSWDGSYYIDSESFRASTSDAQESAAGFAMTQFLPAGGGENLVLGFDRHDRFQHTFIFHRSTPLSLTIETNWDRKEHSPLERCLSERLLFFTSPGAEQGLKAWAMEVARSSPLPPRLQAGRITGWCSWYNLYAAITEENLWELLESTRQVVKSKNLPMRVFQVDDGFTPEMGDWLEVKPQFPRGMKAILEEIRRSGFIPGLWIAPFMVGNRSRLYREHPDWVVQDLQRGGPLIQSAFYGEFRWHKRSEEYYILDATHPQAFDYLRNVFRTWRSDWGCEYFKTDFMFYGSEHGAQRAGWHKPGLTRIEIWRQVAEMIREEIGDSLWLGCGCPLWASAGLVDAVRTGRDTGVRWQDDSATVKRLRDTATRNFANGILWQADPDVVLLREKFHHLSEAELRSSAIYAGLANGVLLTSDDLQQLSPARLQLWQLLLNLSPGECSFPLLDTCAAAFTYQEGTADHSYESTDPVLVQVYQGNPEMVFCFNLYDLPVQRTYFLRSLGLNGPRYVSETVTGEMTNEPVESIHMLLPPHDGRLFILSAQPWKPAVDEP